MPYTIGMEENGVRVCFTGILSNSENTDATIDLYSLPNFEKLNYII